MLWLPVQLMEEGDAVPQVQDTVPVHITEASFCTFLFSEVVVTAFQCLIILPIFIIKMFCCFSI